MVPTFNNKFNITNKVTQSLPQMARIRRQIWRRPQLSKDIYIKGGHPINKYSTERQLWVGQWGGQHSVKELHGDNPGHSQNSADNCGHTCKSVLLQWCAERGRPSCGPGHPSDLNLVVGIHFEISIERELPTQNQEVSKDIHISVQALSCCHWLVSPLALNN